METVDRVPLLVHGFIIRTRSGKYIFVNTLEFQKSYNMNEY